jgi:hypothetical protein
LTKIKHTSKDQYTPQVTETILNKFDVANSFVVGNDASMTDESHISRFRGSQLYRANIKVTTPVSVISFETRMQRKLANPY